MILSVVLYIILYRLPSVYIYRYADISSQYRVVVFTVQRTTRKYGKTHDLDIRTVL